MRTVVFLTLVCLLLSCGAETSSSIEIEMIRDRLNRNACRIAREDLIFQINDLEFINDTSFTVIPFDMLAESLTVCPVTGEQFQMLVDNDDKKIVCPSGHGHTDF